MPDVTIRTTDGAELSITGDDLGAFAATLRGEVLTSASAQYDDARRIWNAMIDRRPAVIVRCRSSADVVRTVRFARRNNLFVTVRGGGHNIGGLALADGAMVIDLSLMRSVRVDPAARIARAEPGATLGDFDRDTQTFGLATPTGINSTTGIAGLTLGGGYGWLSRRFGLTVDNLRAADVVTADGALVTASEHENADLFWAIRGGGGNFGVVTSFEYALHPVGPEIIAGLIVHPANDARGLLRRYRDVVNESSDELTAWVVMRQAPPLPFLPPAVHGKPVVALIVVFTGPVQHADRALAPLRGIGTPHGEHVGPTLYAGFQTTFDPLLAPGARNYWKSHNFSTLHDEVIDTLVDHLQELPGPMCEIFLGQLGGAVGRKSDSATAFAGRETAFVMNVHARWAAPDEDEACIAWARRVFNGTARYAGTGAYVNFMTAEEQERVRAAYGSNYDRLAGIKARYDPSNFFRGNQNIAPARGTTADAAGAGSPGSVGARPGTIRE